MADEGIAPPVKQKKVQMCPECCHVFATRQAKSVHIKKHCRGPSAIKVALDSMKRQVEAVTSELAAMRLQRGGDLTVNNGNISINNNTTVVINVFRQEDMSCIDHQMVRNLVKQRDLEASLQEMVRMIHFDPKVPQNQTVYLPDEKSDHGFSWGSDGTWQRQKTPDLAKLVMLGAVGAMTAHNDEPFEKEYTKAETRRFDEFCNDFDVSEPKRPLAETIITMANNKHVVEAGRAVPPAV